MGHQAHHFNSHDPQTLVGKISAVLPQEEPKNRPAAEPGDIFVSPEGQGARTGSAVLQTWITTSKEGTMASTKQRAAARRNIKKAAAAARRKRTIAHLTKRTRTALGKQAAKVARQKRRRAA
jgi:hypothetical protein